jgi:hypothetical protein
MAQINSGLIAIDTGEAVTAPVRILETKFIHVKAEPGGLSSTRRIG